MKAIVDPNLCIGCTQCAGLCPEVGDIPGEDVPQAVAAAEACPVGAIRTEA